MADWEVALDKQLATWLFWHSPKGPIYMHGYRGAVLNDEPGRTKAAVEQMVANASLVLWQADPIYVTADMMDLLDAAIPAFEPEPLREEDLLIPAGFAYLARPLLIPDARGRRIAHRAIGWAQGRSIREDKGLGLYVTFYSQPGDHDDFDEWDDAGNRGAWFGDALVLDHETSFMFGESAATGAEIIRGIVEAGGTTYDAQMAADSTFALLRALQAFWRLMQQRVAVGFRQRPTRAARHRAARVEYPEDKYVTVVTLRRPRTESSGDHRTVDWHQRWIVSGHWRWQPYPKDGTHRQIWISPYVKGPDDKPLVIRGARVFRWAR